MADILYFFLVALLGVAIGVCANVVYYHSIEPFLDRRRARLERKRVEEYKLQEQQKTAAILARGRPGKNQCRIPMLRKVGHDENETDTIKPIKHLFSDQEHARKQISPFTEEEKKKFDSIKFSKPDSVTYSNQANKLEEDLDETTG